jgi:transketolase
LKSPKTPDFDPALLRRHVIRMAYAGQSVHVPCAFSLIEIASVLYSKILRFNPQDPKDAGRDYLVLSKGHGVMALYACFKELGWLGDKNLDEYFHDASLLRGLAESDIPGLEATAGSLGHGLPVATGIALGLKLKGSSQRVYCVVGDGELNEGSMWEAIAFAGHHKLNNLAVIVDANGLQAMGPTRAVLDMEPLAGKFKSFHFETAESSGHDAAALERALADLSKSPLPQALIARTVKGKGVSFMENDNRWHYTRLTQDSMERALKELAD